MMKKILFTLTFIILLLASLLIPVRTAFAQTTPTTCAIQNAFGYQNVFEDNDQLYLVQYEFEYALAADTPDWVGAEYLGQFADDTEIFASVQPWGYYGATDTTKEWWFIVYVSADTVSSKGITWQAATNKVALAGNPALVWSGAIPYDSTTAIEYSTATTIEETQAELTEKFRALAIYYENISGGASDYIANIDGQWKLTEDGETAFTSTFPAIQVVSPSLFSQGGESPEPTPQINTDRFTTPLNGNAQVYGVNWVAQTFTPHESYASSGIQIRVYRVGNPGFVTVGIRATGGDVPTGTDLASQSIDGDNFTTDTDGEWETFAFSGTYNLNANTTYAIVVRAITGDVNNYIRWLGYEIPYVAEDFECTPLAEPETTYNLYSAFNYYDEHIYQVSGRTWPGGVWQYTYTAQYNIDANAWVEMDGMEDEGAWFGTDSYLGQNRLNGDLFLYQGTGDSDMVQMYDLSADLWIEFNNTQINLYDAYMVHDTTNNILHFYDDNVAGGSIDYSHPVGTGGAWTNNGVTGDSLDIGGEWHEVIVGQIHYWFHRSNNANYITYTEATQTLGTTAYGAGWAYDMWAVWYDEDEGQIYGVWSPTAEAFAPQNAHLCTFNTTSNRWTEGDNLGISAYAGLPDNYEAATASPCGYYYEGYIYMMGLQYSNPAYTTGSPYFKFPVPQLLGEGIEGQRCNSADSGASWTEAPDWDMSFVVMSPTGSPIIPEMPGDWDWGDLPDEMGMSNLWFSSLFWLICTFCMMLASMKVLNSNKGVWSIFILMTPLGWYIGFLAMQIAVGIAMICVFAFIYSFFFRPSGV